MEQLPILSIKNIGIYGIIRESEVDSNLSPEGSVSFAKNVHFDRKGAVALRPGMTLMGSQISDTYSCLGLYPAKFSTSTRNTLLSVFSDGTNNDIYRYVDGVWSKTLEDDTSGLKTRFTTFSDRVIRVNGTDNMKCWSGTGAWETTGNPINPQSMASYDTHFIEVYKSRVYTMAKDSRLYFSSVIDSSGNITWAPTTYYVDINPDDGEESTGLKRFASELLVFKTNHIYRFRTSGADADSLISVGTYSNESIVEGKRGLYFHHSSGIYRYDGGYPQEISRPISDFIDNIPSSSFDDIVAWKDNDHIKFSIGDITVEGISYSNIILRYTESSDLWTIYSTATKITSANEYDNETALTRVVGDEDGNVLRDDYGYTDNGTEISYDLITHWYYKDSLAFTKFISLICSYCEKAQGTKLLYLIDDSKKWNVIGNLTKYLNFFDNKIIEKFHRIKFRIQGISSTEGFIFQGLDILNGVNEGIIKK